MVKPQPAAALHRFDRIKPGFVDSRNDGRLGDIVVPNGHHFGGNVDGDGGDAGNFFDFVGDGAHAMIA